MDTSGFRRELDVQFARLDAVAAAADPAAPVPSCPDLMTPFRAAVGEATQ